MSARDHRPHDARDTPDNYLVLVGVARLDALTQLVGLASAESVIATLRDDVAQLCGEGSRIVVKRGHVEAVLPGGSAEIFASELAALARALEKRIDIDGYLFDRTAVIGAADLRGGALSPDAYCTAEWALARAQVSQEPVILPHSHARSQSENRLVLMRNLQRAIRDDALELHYQPKLHARGGEIAAAEGLVRWTCPDAGPIAPDRFIAIAEATGDIRSLTHWVVGRAVRDFETLSRQGTTLRLDINMSGTSLSDARFTREIIDQLAPARGMIGIEITETAMIADPERALVNLQLCAEAGIRLAIDDYGAGFSSLAYLQQLPVSELKIDRSFILRLASQQRDPLLVRSTIDLAHALEMEVTAEGVDSPQVLALLQVMGCDLVQGFYLSRPLPLDALFRYVTDASQRTRAPDQAIERLRQRIDAARRKSPPAPPGS